jgi:hypothetical protein
MTKEQKANPWNTRLLQPRLPWPARPIRPADVGSGLVDVMLARGNMIEDVTFRKIVPNRYVVEVSPENYAQNYRPIEGRVLQQWREKLMVRLALANSRVGRKEYAFGGQVEILIRPAEGLSETQARVLSQVHIEGAGDTGAGTPIRAVKACLELLGERRRFPLRAGRTILGRDPAADISLSWPAVLERRLVSGQHAYIQAQGAQFRLFDGAPDGRPSVNGTYVNLQPVSRSGHVLRPGDLITLAALNPAAPDPQAPGVVSFYFREECQE